MKIKTSLAKNKKVVGGCIGFTSVIAIYCVWHVVVQGLRILQMIDQTWQGMLS